MRSVGRPGNQPRYPMEPLPEESGRGPLPPGFP